MNHVLDGKIGLAWDFSSVPVPERQTGESRRGVQIRSQISKEVWLWITVRDPCSLIATSGRSNGSLSCHHTSQTS